MHATVGRRALTAGLAAGLSLVPVAATSTAAPAGAAPLANRPVVSSRPATGPVRAAAYRAEVLTAAVPGWAGDAAAAGGWLLGQRQPDGTLPGPGAGPDFGLTIDALWALEATGAAGADVRRTWAALSTPQAVSEFTGPSYYTSMGRPGARFGGQSAKLLLAAATMGVDVTHVGGRDLRAQTLALVVSSGPDVGRIHDVDTYADNSNTLGQALGVIGLSVTGGAPQPVVNYLLAQQCPSGGFRMYATDHLSCAAAAPDAATPDTDGTALAVQALLAARTNGRAVPTAAVENALTWLVRTQHSDGSFIGGVGTDVPNSNSTGLAAEALQAGGRPSQAARAAAWVGSLQATPARAARTPLASDVGAIAYDPSGYTAALAHGIGAADADQWRRATSEAVFALTPVTLASLVHHAPGTGPTAPTRPSAPTASSRPTAPTGPTAARSPTHPTSTHTPPTSRTTPPSPNSHANSTSATRTPQPARHAPLAHAARPAQPLTDPVYAADSRGPTTPVAAHTTSSTASSRSDPYPTTTTNAVPVPPLSSSPATGPRVEAAAQHPATASSGNGLAVLWAVVVGGLLGVVVVARPWRRLPRGRHTQRPAS